jgi:hypothetical protein
MARDIRVRVVSIEFADCEICRRRHKTQFLAI